jgi:hypothetical protein
MKQKSLVQISLPLLCGHVKKKKTLIYLIIENINHYWSLELYIQCILRAKDFYRYK